ncbi:MAG: hypothetical protein GY755_08875 [Chloroflexi bacterium]|nr:hypothetical protein [Chloroflexota bacterium]
MYKKRWSFLVLVFVFALTTACGGGAPAPAPVEEAPVVEEAPPPAEEEVEAPAQEEAPAAPAETETEFPLPDDVDSSTVMDLGNGAINFQTELSIPDVVTFYRFAFPDYTEREILTVVTDASLNLVFDGHESGMAIVIQGFPMGDAGNNVSIRLEAID